MNKSEEFRTYAAECEKLAREAKDPNTKRRFDEMAVDWKQMADYLERRGK